MYAGIGAAVLICCIVAGLLKYRANMKKRRSPYEQWIDYAASKQEGRRYRADTHVREPPQAVGLPGRKHDLNVEMRDVIPKLTMQHDLRDHMPSAPKEKKLGSIGEFDVTDFYRHSKGKQSSLSGQPETNGAAEGEAGDGDEDEEGGDKFGENMRSPAAATSRLAHAASAKKSRSVFGSFNPLVVGSASTSPQGAIVATPAGLLGATVNNPLNNRISHRINFNMSPNLTTPVQSPASLAAARDSAERIHEHGFEDDEDDADDGDGDEYYGEEDPTYAGQYK